jgi:hypothetical protein
VVLPSLGARAVLAAPLVISEKKYPICIQNPNMDPTAVSAIFLLKQMFFLDTGPQKTD